MRSDRLLNENELQVIKERHKRSLIMFSNFKLIAEVIREAEIEVAQELAPPKKFTKTELEWHENKSTLKITP